MLRRLLAPALVVVALVGATACGGSQEPTAERPQRAARPEPPLLSSRELAWIRGFSALAELLYDGNLTAGRSGQRTCFERLEKAGESPTARLRPAYVAVRAACSKLGTGGFKQTEQLFDETFDRLGPLFLSSRALRVAPSPDNASHVDLRLGELASAVSGESIEVRCWSARDWRRLIVEENAWDAAEEDPETLDGLALTDDGQMHLLLEDCNLLGRLRHKDAADLRGEEIEDAADAVSNDLPDEYLKDCGG